MDTVASRIYSDGFLVSDSQDVAFEGKDTVYPANIRPELRN